jgi:hypothetical protein
MLKYLRYALATLCFAASVVCLALWWRSYAFADLLISPSSIGSFEFMVGSASGSAYLVADDPMPPSSTWSYSASRIDDTLDSEGPARMFGVYDVGIWFPHWYPALIFALAGVAALRLGRRFMLRSAIIATSILCALLGMAAVL